MDKCTIELLPLLKMYDTGVPTSVFSCLMLHLKEDMERLFTIEEYLDQRKRDANPNYPNILTDAVSANSFPVQFFGQSSIHQTLKATIEEQARRDRARKEKDLDAKKAQVSHGSDTCLSSP